MAVKKQVVYFICLYMKFVVYETRLFPHKTNCKEKMNSFLLMSRTQKWLTDVEIFFPPLPQNHQILAVV